MNTREPIIARLAHLQEKRHLVMHYQRSKGNDFYLLHNIILFHGDVRCGCFCIDKSSTKGAKVMSEFAFQESIDACTRYTIDGKVVTSKELICGCLEEMAQLRSDLEAAKAENAKLQVRLAVISAIIDEHNKEIENELQRQSFAAGNVGLHQIESAEEKEICENDEL